MCRELPVPYLSSVNMMSRDCPETPSRGVDSSWNTSTSDARQHSPRRSLVTSGAGSCRKNDIPQDTRVIQVASHALEYA